MPVIKLLQQGYRYHKLRKTFSKFYRRHYELGCLIQCWIKNTFASRPIGTGILWRLSIQIKNNVGWANFSDQLKKKTYVTNVLDIT